MLVKACQSETLLFGGNNLGQRPPEATGGGR